VQLQEFNIKPSLSIDQFLTGGFLESKINFCSTLITSVKQLDVKLKNKKPSKSKVSQTQPQAQTQTQVQKEKVVCKILFF